MKYRVEVAKKVVKFLKKQPIWLIDVFEEKVDKLAKNPY